MENMNMEEILKELTNPSLRIKLEIGAFEHTVGAKTNLPLKKLMKEEDPAEIIGMVIHEMTDGIFKRLQDQIAEDLKKGE